MKIYQSKGEKMTINYEIDSLDLKIITELQKNGRKPFLDIARKLAVSGGTIHQRVEKMKEIGIIQGSKIILDYKKLGFGVTVLVGVNLSHANKVLEVIDELKKIPEILEVHYTTGSYSLFLKIITKDIDDFHLFLIKKLQVIPNISSTESFICLNSPVLREFSSYLPDQAGQE